MINRILIYFFVFIFSSFLCLGQKIDTIINKVIYKSYYSISLKTPLYVEYDLFNGGGSISRKQFYFKKEALTLNDQSYKSINKGLIKYDRGHLANAEDFAFDYYKEKLTFSYYNCLPQTRKLNRGIWKIWETAIRNQSRKWPLRIYCGGIFEYPSLNSIAIPSYCWKVVINLKTHSIMHVLLFKNDNSGLVQRINISELKKILNYDFIINYY
jgi:endonuclease G